MLEVCQSCWFCGSGLGKVGLFGPLTGGNSVMGGNGVEVVGGFRFCGEGGLGLLDGPGFVISGEVLVFA